MAKATTSKSESLTVRVPVALMAELRAEASEHNQTLASVVVNRLWAVGRQRVCIAELETTAFDLSALTREQNSRIAELEKALVTEKSRPRPAVVFDSPPVMRGGPTDFPARPVYQRGQGPRKSKRATNAGADNGQ